MQEILDYLVEMNSRIDRRFDVLETSMTEGFAGVGVAIDDLSESIQEDFIILDRRMAKLEA